MKVTVIIPIYNVELYIEKCLKSILNQTYKNLEILIVNDGTEDKSMDIVEKYQNDRRIKIIEQRNMGLSAARNIGLKYATGEYIMFVDSDDWLDLDCIEKCVNMLEKTKVDVVLFPRINEYKNLSIKRNIFCSQQLFENKEKVREIILRRLFGLLKEELKTPLKLEDLNSAWGKLYKREKIKNEFIDTKIIGSEDGIFNIEVFLNINKAIYIDNIYYHYRKDNITSLTQIYNEEKYKKFKNMYSIMEKYIEQENLDEDYREALLNRKVLNLFSFILNIHFSKLDLAEKIKEINKLLNDAKKDLLFYKFNFKYLDMKWYIFYKLCQYKCSYILLFLMYFSEKGRNFYYKILGV